MWEMMLFLVDFDFKITFVHICAFNHSTHPKCKRWSRFLFPDFLEKLTNIYINIYLHKFCDVLRGLFFEILCFLSKRRCFQIPFLQCNFSKARLTPSCNLVEWSIVQGTIGCTPNSVPMVFIVFSWDSWGL